MQQLGTSKNKKGHHPNTPPLWETSRAQCRKRYGRQILKNKIVMYWTLDSISRLKDAPFPATKEELLDYAVRCGAPHEVTLNLQKLEEEEDRIYVGLQDIWPDITMESEDFLFNQNEY
jgi:hypothetical protein